MRVEVLSCYRNKETGARIVKIRRSRLFRKPVEEIRVNTSGGPFFWNDKNGDGLIGATECVISDAFDAQESLGLVKNWESTE